MKIAKYIFFLLVLLAFALFVFISTQPNSFSISETKTINASKELVFDYTNDLNTWKSWWIPFNENRANIKPDSTIVEYDANLIEKQAVFAKDSIQFAVFDNNFTGNSTLVFNALEAKKSEITWKVSGDISFKMKFISFFKGGMQNILDDILQQSMENINTELQSKFDTFSIVLNGFEEKNGCQYIAIQDSTSVDNFDQKRKELFKKLGQFITNNNLTTNGDPFVIFKSRSKESYKYLSCIPVTTVLDSIAVDSTMTKGKFDSYLALKMTLKGSYSNRNNTWKEGTKAISNSNYKENKEGLYIEVYKKESKQVPANNVTEIYIPVRKPIIANEPEKDSLQPTETTKDSI